MANPMLAVFWRGGEGGRDPLSGRPAQVHKFAASSFVSSFSPYRMLIRLHDM